MMFLMPIYDQQELALHLLRSGSAMFLGGLIIGLAVYGSKYPRITLYAHIEATSYGGSMLVVALIISQTQFIGNLNSWELFAIWLGQIVGWPMWLSQVAQSFWGTNQMNKIVAAQAKAPGGKPWQENLVLATHYSAALGIVGWAVMLKCLMFPRL